MVLPDTDPIVGIAVVGVLAALVGIGFWIGRRRGTNPSAVTTSDRDASSESEGRSRLPFLERDETNTDRAIDPRILLPITIDEPRPQRFLGFACALKDQYGHRPIHLYSVVDPEESVDTERAVARTTELLEELAVCEATAMTAIATDVSVGSDVPAEILQKIRETDPDLVVMGWSDDRFLEYGTLSEGGEELEGASVMGGSSSLEDTSTEENFSTGELRRSTADTERTPSTSRYGFGSIADALLEGTLLPIYVVRHRTEAFPTIHVVLPWQIDHHEGFYEAIYNVKQLAQAFDASVRAYVFVDRVQQYENLFDLVEIDVPAAFESVQSWNALYSTLAEDSEPGEYVVVLMPRVGETGWDDELFDAPCRLASLPGRSVATFVLRGDESERPEQFFRTEESQ